MIGAPDSVRPKISTTRQPVSCSNRSMGSTGNGAAPDTQYRMLVRSYLFTSGWFVRAMNMVGTPGNQVGLTSWMVWSTSPGSNCGIRCMATPAARHQTEIRLPMMWNRGMTRRKESFWAVICGSRLLSISDVYTRLRWASTAPLERPVVPPV